MALIKSSFVLINCLVYLTIAQNVPAGIQSVSKGLDKFSLNLLAQTNDEAGDNLNIAISPYTIWTLLTIISEGARGNTLTELENTLGLPSGNKNQFRNNIRVLANNLKQNAEGVTLDITNAIFASTESSLNKSFQQISQTIYNTDVLPVDFKNPQTASETINRYIATATKNKIPNFVEPETVRDAAIFMTSAMFFKGQWRNRFDKADTKLETFFDDNGKKKGQVEMMYQSGNFPYTVITSLQSHVIELPYGNSDMSMLVFVPRKGGKLSTILKLLAATPLSDILENLATVEKEFGGEDVDVYLPKFKFESQLNLNAVLEYMGIRDLFNSDKADLLGIYSDYLFVSRVLQKAVIDVDEDGTIAAAAAGASIIYKTTQPKFTANKPFAFLIVEKKTQSILFAGKVSNPKGICDKCTGN